MDMDVSIAGFFDGKPLNQDVQLAFPGDSVSLSTILEKVNQQLGMKFATTKTVKKGQVNILLNGEKIEAKEIKIYMVNDGDTLTIVTPIMGG